MCEQILMNTQTSRDYIQLLLDNQADFTVDLIESKRVILLSIRKEDYLHYLLLFNK